MSSRTSRSGGVILEI